MKKRITCLILLITILMAFSFSQAGAAAAAETPGSGIKLVDKGGASWVYLNWDYPSDFSQRFSVYRSINGEAYTKIKEQSFGLYFDNSLMEGNTYSYYVTRVDNGAESERSNEISFSMSGKTKQPVTAEGREQAASLQAVKKEEYSLQSANSLAAPVLTLSNPSSGEISASWTGISTAAGYELVLGGESYRVSGTSKKISGLLQGLNYSGYVRAYKTVSGKTYYSPYSAAVSIRVDYTDQVSLGRITPFAWKSGSWSGYIDREGGTDVIQGYYDSAYQWVTDAGVKDGMDKETAYKKIAQYISEKVTYGSGHSWKYCITKGKGACDAYAQLVQVMCNIAGIENYFCQGRAAANGVRGSHAWNKVRFSADGKWYYSDITWYDSDGDENISAYLLSESLWSSHEASFSAPKKSMQFPTDFRFLPIVTYYE